MADLYNQLISDTPIQYGQVQYFEPLNDAALNDDWFLPSLVGGGLGLFRSSLGALNNFYRAKNIYDIWDKRKYWGIPFRKASENPRKAVQTLKENEMGFVPNADGKGTDFVWGKYIPPIKKGKKGGGFGLSHIEGRRFEDGYNGEDFINNIVPNLFENGKKYSKKGHPGRYYLGTDNEEAVIRTDFNGKPWEWLDSAYFKYEDK